MFGSGKHEVPPVRLDLSLWQVLGGKGRAYRMCSCSWVTGPLIQLEEAAASRTAEATDTQCPEGCLKS